MPGAPTVLLVDDDDLFRAGLRTMLELEGIVVCADARLSSRPAELVCDRRPDVVLMDPTPSAATAGNGSHSNSDALVRLLQRVPQARVIVVSEHDDAGSLAAACRAGARGYLRKRTPLAELVAGIHAVAAGEGCLCSRLAAAAVALLREGSPLTQHTAAARDDVSTRELEVLRLLALGIDNAQIAAELGISTLTVKNHLSSIFVKLGFDNRVQAAVFAVRSGIA